LFVYLQGKIRDISVKTSSHQQRSFFSARIKNNE